MNLLRFPVVLLGLGLAACSNETTSNDASVADVGADAGTDVPNDRGGSDVVATDVAADSGVADVAVDSPTDVAIDTPVDVAVDAPTDAAADVPTTDADDPSAARCTGTGGTVQMSLCCGATPDFPSSCLTGACGCAPSSSHMVQVCRCPGETCFDPAVGCRAR